MAERRFFFFKKQAASQISWSMTTYRESLIILSIRKVYNSIQEAGKAFKMEFGIKENNHLEAEK